MHVKRKEKHKQHFRILINGKSFKILSLSEETHIDKRFNTCEERLCIKTKIRGQGFPTQAFIKTIANDGNIEYHCTWIGTFGAPNIEEYIYRIDLKQSVD